MANLTGRAEFERSERMSTMGTKTMGTASEAHTAGPWSVCCDGKCRTGYLFGADGETYVGQLFGPSHLGEEHSVDPVPNEDMQQENIRFVLRAVNSHGALVAALESVAGVFEGQDDVPIYVRKARAALAQAKGES